MEYYANAVRAEPDLCWRMVSRGPGLHSDSVRVFPESSAILRRFVFWDIDLTFRSLPADQEDYAEADKAP